MTFSMQPVPGLLARNPVYRSVALARVRAACQHLQILALGTPDLTPRRELIADAEGALRIARALGCPGLDAALEALGEMAADGFRWRAARAGLVDDALGAAARRVCTATQADLDRAGPMAFPPKASTT